MPLATIVVVDLSLNPSGNVNISNDLTVSDISASGMNLSNNLSVSGETSFIIILILLMQMLIFPIHRDSLFIKIQTDASSVFQLKMHKDIQHLIHVILMHITPATIRRLAFIEYS